jgi:hypothetical protein
MVEVKDLTQLKSDDLWREVKWDEDASFRYSGAPYKFSRSPWQISRRVPLLVNIISRYWERSWGSPGRR